MNASPSHEAPREEPLVVIERVPFALCFHGGVEVARQLVIFVTKRADVPEVVLEQEDARREVRGTTVAVAERLTASNAVREVRGSDSDTRRVAWGGEVGVIRLG